MHSPRLLLALGLGLALTSVSLFSAEPASATMASAATKLLASLTPDQKQKAQFAFDSDERTHWHFIPNAQFPRNGLYLYDVTPAQRELAYQLLATGLSQRGNLTAHTIMDLEAVLQTLEVERGVAPPGRPPRDPRKYFVSVFGDPSPRGTWGWRVEGHHVSLQFTIVNGKVTVSTPTFFGVNPAVVPEGEHKGLRALAPEEDTARALLMALDAGQRQKAVVTTEAPEDILTMNNLPISPLSPVGIAASAMTGRQREMLLAVLDAYAGLMTPEIARERMSRLTKTGIEKITFAWAGDAERGKKHYYRVQGPTFLIEYDNTQNDANHIHSVWRDFDGDFGRDLLREHLKSAH